MLPAGAWIFPDAPVEQVVRICQLLDEAGFAYAWIGDEALNRDCFVTIGAALAATKRIRVGTGITNPYTRHPAMAAAATATLDELSGGRALLGYGPGAFATLSPMGLRWEHPLTALREAISIARRLFSGERVDFEGDLFRLRSAQLPYARAGIEVHMAGRGRHVLELAGELCDGVLISGKARFDLPETVAYVHTGAKRSGNRPRVFYASDVCFDDDSRARSRARQLKVIAGFAQSVKDRLGFTPEIEARIGRWDQPSAAAALTDSMLDELAYVGNRGRVGQQIEADMSRHGIDVFVVNLEASLPLSRVGAIAEVVRSAVAGRGGTSG